MFSKQHKSYIIFLATFVRKLVTKKFQKSPNLVTLDCWCALCLMVIKFVIRRISFLLFKMLRNLTHNTQLEAKQGQAWRHDFVLNAKKVFDCKDLWWREVGARIWSKVNSFYVKNFRKIKWRCFFLGQWLLPKVKNPGSKPNHWQFDQITIFTKLLVRKWEKFYKWKVEIFKKVFRL